MQVVELRQYLGENGDALPFVNQETRRRWEALRGRLVSEIERLGLTVAPGRYRG